MVLCMTGISSWSVPLAQCADLASQPGRAQQWRSCKHLIIDEISMVNTTYFFIYLFFFLIDFIGILLSYKSNKREVTRTKKKKKKIAKRE